MRKMLEMALRTRRLSCAVLCVVLALVTHPALAQCTTGPPLFELLAEGAYAIHSPDGEYLAIVLRSAIDVYDGDGYAWLARFQAPRLGMQIGVPSISSGAELLAAPMTEDLVIVWDMASGAEVLRIDLRTVPFRRTAFSPDGEQLAVLSENSIQLRDSATGDLIRSLSAGVDPVIAMAFSPDGDRLASGGGDGAVRMWNPRTGGLEETLEGHTREVGAICFSRDGKYLASGSGDSTVRVVEMSSGEAIVLEGHSGPITSAGFSPTGTHLVTGSHDDKVILWDLQSLSPVASLDLWALLGSLGDLELPNPKEQARVLATEFGPTGTCVAVSYCAGFYCRVGIWEVAEFVQ